MIYIQMTTTGHMINIADNFSLRTSDVRTLFESARQKSKVFDIKSYKKSHKYDTA